MKVTLPIRMGALAALAIGMVAAQAPAPKPEQGAGPGWKQGKMRGRMGGGMGMQSRLWAEALGLTEAQKAQARTIFTEAREAAKPVREQMRAERQALREAVRAGKSDQEIDSLAANQGSLMGKLIAIRAKAQGRFHALLTPEQQQKHDSLLNSGRRGSGGGV